MDCHFISSSNNHLEDNSLSIESIDDILSIKDQLEVKDSQDNQNQSLIKQEETNSKELASSNQHVEDSSISIESIDDKLDIKEHLQINDVVENDQSCQNQNVISHQIISQSSIDIKKQCYIQTNAQQDTQNKFQLGNVFEFQGGQDKLPQKLNQNFFQDKQQIYELNSKLIQINQSQQHKQLSDINKQNLFQIQSYQAIQNNNYPQLSNNQMIGLNNNQFCVQQNQFGIGKQNLNQCLIPDNQNNQFSFQKCQQNFSQQQNQEQNHTMNYNQLDLNQNKIKNQNYNQNEMFKSNSQSQNIQQNKNQTQEGNFNFINNKQFEQNNTLYNNIQYTFGLYQNTIPQANVQNIDLSNYQNINNEYQKTHLLQNNIVSNSTQHEQISLQIQNQKQDTSQNPNSFSYDNQQNQFKQQTEGQLNNLSQNQQSFQIESTFNNNINSNTNDNLKYNQNGSNTQINDLNQKIKPLNYISQSNKDQNQQIDQIFYQHFNQLQESYEIQYKQNKIKIKKQKFQPNQMNLQFLHVIHEFTSQSFNQSQYYSKNNNQTVQPQSLLQYAQEQYPHNKQKQIQFDDIYKENQDSFNYILNLRRGDQSFFRATMTGFLFALLNEEESYEQDMFQQIFIKFYYIECKDINLLDQPYSGVLDLNKPMQYRNYFLNCILYLLAIKFSDQSDGFVTSELLKMCYKDDAFDFSMICFGISLCNAELLSLKSDEVFSQFFDNSIGQIDFYQFEMNEIYQHALIRQLQVDLKLFVLTIDQKNKKLFKVAEELIIPGQKQAIFNLKMIMNDNIYQLIFDEIEVKNFKYLKDRSKTVETLNKNSKLAKIKQKEVVQCFQCGNEIEFKQYLHCIQDELTKQKFYFCVEHIFYIISKNTDQKYQIKYSFKLLGNYKEEFHIYVDKDKLNSLFEYIIIEQFPNLKTQCYFCQNKEKNELIDLDHCQEFIKPVICIKCASITIKKSKCLKESFQKFQNPLNKQNIAEETNKQKSKEDYSTQQYYPKIVEQLSKQEENQTNFQINQKHEKDINLSSQQQQQINLIQEQRQAMFQTHSYNQLKKSSIQSLQQRSSNNLDQQKQQQINQQDIIVNNSQAVNQDQKQGIKTIRQQNQQVDKYYQTLNEINQQCKQTIQMLQITKTVDNTQKNGFLILKEDQNQLKDQIQKAPCTKCNYQNDFIAQDAYAIFLKMFSKKKIYTQKHSQIIFTIATNVNIDFLINLLKINLLQIYNQTFYKKLSAHNVIVKFY
ncbi:hypothetical protein ABPG73_021567 [Tetrahymena malaccensis]